MSTYRKHQKVENKDANGWPHHNDVITSALVAE